MTPLRQTRFGEHGNCWQAAIACIVEVPVEACVDVLDGRVPERLWFERSELWCLAMGWRIEVCTDPPSGFAIAVGDTERVNGQDHAVIMLDGALYWDPHPSDLYINMPPKHYVSFKRIDYSARQP